MKETAKPPRVYFPIFKGFAPFIHRYREEIEDRMLHYCLAHLAYHFSRQLPKRSRAKFEILVLFLVTVLLFPQIFVLLRVRLC
ncbi:uncharacterized protein LOC144509825 isoform X3 [Mustelus asterias]